MRAAEVGISRVYQGAKVKIVAYEKLLADTGLGDDDVAYIGDDLPDMPIMRRVGFPACPENAVDEIREISQYVSAAAGGMGAVREIAEYILKRQNKWQIVLDRYFL